MPFALILWILLSAFIGFMGRNRILGFWGSFFLSLFVSPFVGAMAVAISREAQPPQT